MPPFRFMLLLQILISLLLGGCAEQPDPPAAGDTPSAREQTSVQPAAGPIIDVEQARKDYAQTPFTVLQIGEREWNGAPALAVTFSVPLAPETVLERHLSVLNSQKQSVEGGWMLDASGAVALFPFVLPETRYQVAVGADIPALTGSRLEESPEQALTQWVTTAALPAMVRFTSRGAQLSPELTDGLEIEAVNVSAVDLDLWLVREDRISAFAANPLDGHVSDVQQLQEIATLEYSARFDLETGPNQRLRRLLPMRDLPPLARPGVWMAVLKAAEDYPWQYAVTWFTVSDLTLHVRRYESRLLAWVHGVTDAEPRAGVEIQLLDVRGTALRTAHSDQQGAVLLEGVEPEATLVLARRDRQLALVSLQRPALDLTEFELPRRAQRPQELFLYSPRDIYRPGETLILNALLRDHDGRLAEDQSNQPIQAVLTRPDGRVHLSFVWQGDDQGFYTSRIALPLDTLTGKWLFQATLGNGDSFAYPVHVEDFLPERMRLILDDELPQAPPLTTIPILTVHGEYLWGAPAAGNRLETTLRVSGTQRISDRFADFLFGPATPELQETLELPAQSLDDAGKAVLELPNHWSSTDRPIQVQAVVSLFESGGRPVTRSWRTVLWPAPSLVGLRPMWTGPIADPNGQIGFELIHINAEDRLLGMDAVQATLIRENHNHYWGWSEDGWSRQDSPEEQTVFTRVVSWEDGERPSLTVPVEYGQYRIELRDAQGRLLTGHRFFAGWRWDRAQDGQGARPEQVALAWDAPAYGPGDVATLALTAPFDGRALVTVEGPALLWQDTVAVRDGQAEIRIPVSEHWDRHDIYATAMVLRPGRRALSEAEQRMPRRAWGMRHLPLDRSARDLHLSIDAPDQVLPETRLDVTVHIQAPQRDHPVAVTLAAVDVGVLSLTRFQSPDPLAWFFGPRAYSAALRDTYGDLMEISRAAAARQRFGGDADLARGGDAPLSEVQIVALFSGKVFLDDDGRAEISLDLPYFNGELRLMAVAFDDHRVGSTDRPLTVAAPVVAEINLPRFLAQGDRVHAGWDIQNMLPENREVRVTMTSDPALGANQVTHEVRLEASRRIHLQLPLEAVLAEGRGELHLTMHSMDGLEPKIAVDRTWALSLRPPYPAQRRVHRRMVPAGQGHVLADPMTDPEAAAALPGTVETRLVVAAVPPLDLDDHFQHLVQYPYGCLEQTASRLWPLLLGTAEDWARYEAQNPGHALAEDHNRITGQTTSQAVSQTISQAIGRIAGMQRYDGSFGAWGNDGEEAHWLTVYAADLLLAARERGHGVDAGVLDRALRRIGQYLTAEQGIPGEGLWFTEAPDHYRLAYRAYAALVLSGVQQARLAAVRQLYDQHADAARSPLPLAQLALALERLGDVRRAAQAWQKALSWTEVQPFYGGDYGSAVRDLAWTLLLSQESRLSDQPRQPASQAWELIFPLQQALRDQTWLSTQERMALYRLALLLRQRPDTPWNAVLHFFPPTEQSPSVPSEPELSLSITSEGTWTRHWGSGTFPAQAELENTDSRPLYLTFTVQGYPVRTPREVSEGIVVERQFYDLTGEPLEMATLTSGDWVLVRLRVQPQAQTLDMGQNRFPVIPDALVVDFLPAGLELDNPGLEGATRFDQVVVEGQTVQHWQQHTRLAHQEFRDDRYVAAVALDGYQPAELFYLARAVTPGQFTIPPTQVEDMYRPTLRAVGRTPGMLTIQNRVVPAN